MYIGHFNTPTTLLNRVAPRRLLVMAGQAPANGGDSAAHAFLDQMTQQADLQVELIDSTPMAAYCASRPGLFELAATWGSCRALWRYVCALRRCDAVLLFANSSVIFFWAVLLLRLARLWGRRFLLKPTGSDLDLRLAAQNLEHQHELIQLLNRMDGVLADTLQLQQALQRLGVTAACYVPAWCTQPTLYLPPPPLVEETRALRLLYLSPIQRDKGAFELLHALQQLAYHSQYQLICDFYGPILPEEQTAFLAELLQTPQARYLGLAEPGQQASLMAQYDALVLPTYCPTEGHPGVMLDAMMAGLPIISTYHRAIPELVQQGVTGLLAPVQDSTALKTAIVQLAQDPPLRQQMGAAAYSRSQTFRAEQIVPRILQLLFPNS